MQVGGEEDHHSGLHIDLHQTYHVEPEPLSTCHLTYVMVLEGWFTSGGCDTSTHSRNETGTVIVIAPVISTPI